MQSNLTNQINFNVRGIYDYLTPEQKIEYDGLAEVLKKLENIKNGRAPVELYANLLTNQQLEVALKGVTFLNNWGAICKIDKVSSANGKKLLTIETQDERYKSKTFTMFLNTLVTDKGIQFSSHNIYQRYFTVVGRNNVDSYIEHVKMRIQKYNDLYAAKAASTNKGVQDELASKTNNSKVTRQAILRAMSEIRQDEKSLRDAFNSSLSTDEIDELIYWIASKVYVMRLGVLKDGVYDQAISELFPDSIYGIKNRTEASELSKDYLSGYVSLYNVDDAPIDILKKVTGKLNADDIFKKYPTGNKYRLNNTALVLYLLQNYNDNGFKTGVPKLRDTLTI